MLELSRSDGWWTVTLVAKELHELEDAPDGSKRNEFHYHVVASQALGSQEHRVKAESLRPFWVWRPMKGEGLPTEAVAIAGVPPSRATLGQWLSGTPDPQSLEGHCKLNDASLEGGPPFAASLFDANTVHRERRVHRHSPTATLT